MCPVIVVTADSDERRVVEALDLGADDYVAKPFNPNVLLARARVALRHHVEISTSVGESLLHAGDVQLDLSGYQVKIGEDVIDMHPRQFALLAILVRHQGRVLTYATLDHALGTSEGASNARHDERNPWRVAISRIRKQLGTGPRRPTIHTEHRVGYRLTVPDIEVLDIPVTTPVVMSSSWCRRA